MSMDLTGITNKNEYYTNHYFSTVFEENAGDTIKAWNVAARESEEIHTPWSNLRRNATQFYAAHDRFIRSSVNMQTLQNICDLADGYLKSLGYPEATPQALQVNDTLQVPVYLEMKKTNGAPLLWVVLMASLEKDVGIMESYALDTALVTEEAFGTVYKGVLGETPGEALATKILFGQNEPPRFLMYIGMNQIALIDRNKWNEKRYLQFELEEIFSRLENTTLQAMSVLLHRDSLCPDDGKILLDELDEQSQRNASGVSQDLKYALRESIELLGNEVLYDMKARLGRDLEAEPVDAGQLTLECLRYMYRMLFVLFIEARPELGYAPIKAQSYYTGYSLESLRDIADNIRDEVTEVGEGYYLHETLAKLYDLIYAGYPTTEEDLKKATGKGSLHDMFFIAPLKAHIFDPEYTRMITQCKLRNSCMLKIIELMSLTKSTGRRNSRRGRISYANLGINQMGAVYEALLSYRGFIAEQDLYEVKRAGDSFNELDVGYFVSESELSQYSEDERVRYEFGEKKGKLRKYEKGTFIYRLAGREREKSASYYTPEVLTKCLVKHALNELLEGKTADQILDMTICEPAMGSAAFLNEAINQLAEAYISRKEQETGNIISYEDRFNELQKVKMYIADRNVYGIDLNPVAVELAEVSLWLNTIYEGGFVPWFGTQLVNGNSLIGARRQVYSEAYLKTSSKGLHWYENTPERVPLGIERKKRRGNAQIYHFLLGDPGMCSYSDKVIKHLEPDNIKKMKDWNKKFTAPYTDNELESLRQLSLAVDELWKNQVKLRKTVEEETQDAIAIFGRDNSGEEPHTTIRQKDLIYSKLYKSEHMKNAGPYARLKFAMDYWCALWFWPINQAELLPSRSEFFNDLNLILVGTFSTKGNSNMLQYQQLSLFPTEQEQIVSRINELFPGQSEVDIDNLCALFPRLALVRQIAEQNHFLHWELEFADLFAEKGGFDLMIGNPPWILLKWNEKDVLADSNPVFAVKKLSATQTIRQRELELIVDNTRRLYFAEYEAISGEQVFLNAKQNYPDLVGMKANLYKCFLPQAWMYGNKNGISAFVHPEGVFNDPQGRDLRKRIYPKMRKHFRFSNALKLFEDVHTSREFGLNIYSNNETAKFDQIVNLYNPSTITESYDSEDMSVAPMRTTDGKRNMRGRKSRILQIGKEELLLFAKIIEGNEEYDSTRLMNLHIKHFIDILSKFAEAEERLTDYQNSIFASQMWNETNAQNDKIIVRNVGFGNLETTILSGAHIGLYNPFFNCSNRGCHGNNDNTSIDLTIISESYLQRTNYKPKCSFDNYYKQSPATNWGSKYIDYYRLVVRRRIDIEGERTLIPTLIPPKEAHTNGIIGFAFKDNTLLALTLGCFGSLPYDFYIKIYGKGDFYGDTAMSLPINTQNKDLSKEIICRTIMLNCLNNNYTSFWKSVFDNSFITFSWASNSNKLNKNIFASLSDSWKYESVLRSDFERRQASIEIDVLVSMLLGLSLEQLLAIYKVQFPILQQHEKETYYDANGRIVFAKNNALTGVGFLRAEWESCLKGASAGQKFYRTIIDDTIPGGPTERTIEYVAPFDRCDREQDYETAWKFFEDKYRMK